MLFTKSPVSKLIVSHNLSTTAFRVLILISNYKSLTTFSNCLEFITIITFIIIRRITEIII